MRHTLFIGLMLVVPSAATVADTPIPQDAVRMEKRRRDWLEWNRRTLRIAYDKVGKKDARWDAPARESLELTARMFSMAIDPEVTFLEIIKPAKTAIDAGCDDPLVVYLHARSQTGPNYPGADEMARRVKVSAKALAASRYPAFRRWFALARAGTYMLEVPNPGKEVRQEAERSFDAALALLPESIATDERNEFWEGQMLDVLLELIKGYRTLGVAAPEAYERVDNHLGRLPEMKVQRLLLRGHFWYGYGWEARTTRFAAAVPEGGFESFGKRVEVAREAFQEAWNLRPGVARAATALLDIDKSVGGDRATMELWFRRAMEADGDNRGACLTKLDWLDPKWHGTAEEMIAFGRACRDTKNWYAGIPLLVADAHFRHVGMLVGEDQAGYMRSPEVWSDIKPVFEEYLKHRPHDDVARCKYATFSFLGGHYREAREQFEILGDRLAAWSEFPYVPLEILKRYRSEAMQFFSSKPREDDPKGDKLGVDAPHRPK